jgi:hypothetical protein
MTKLIGCTTGGSEFHSLQWRQVYSFPKCLDLLWNPLKFLLNEYRGYDGRGLKLAAYRQPVPHFRTSAVLHPLLHVPSYCAYGQTLLKSIWPFGYCLFKPNCSLCGQRNRKSWRFFFSVCRLSLLFSFRRAHCEAAEQFCLVVRVTGWDKQYRLHFCLGVK